MRTTTATTAQSLLLVVALLALACQDPVFGGSEITIEVSGVGNGSGRVTGPAVTELQCALTQHSAVGCKSTFFDAGAGGAFTLDAFPDSVSRFVEWGGACTGLICTLSFPPGRDTTFRVSARFVLKLDSVNRPPVAEIITPNAIREFPGDQPVSFAGIARDPEDGLLPASALEWSSSRDGSLGFGISLSRVLSLGGHRITLRATDSQGAVGTDSLDIAVTGACAGQPRAWYRLDGDGGDASGNGNHGTVQGALSIANRHGEAGKALAFDGIDDSVELGDVFNTLALPFSIAVWVYRLSSADELLRALFVSDDEPGRYAGIWFQADPLGHPSITFADGNGSGAAFRRTFTAGTPILSDTWVHLVATVRGATDMTLYMNGVAMSGVYSGTGGALLHTQAPARIGRITMLPTNRPWLGRLDELRIYNCSLDAGEVAALHAQQ